MRKNILILFCLLVVFFLAACNSSDTEIDGDSTDGDMVDGDKDSSDNDADTADSDVSDGDYDGISPDGDEADGDEDGNQPDGDDAENDDDNQQTDGDITENDLDIEKEIEGVPCENWDDCKAANLGCDSFSCDLNWGVCRCICSEDKDCVNKKCYNGFCVNCAEDSHCKEEITCSSEPDNTARCKVDTQTCVCGGKCGDGNCDQAEQALGICPEDCDSCIAGQVKAFACMSGVEVEWCKCKDSKWNCVENPATLCDEQNDCARQGGQCVSSMEYCEGQQASSSLGCTNPDSICCVPNECGTAGTTYYPVFGQCCPGLITVDSNMLMDNYDQENPGLICMANCWSQTCAPCGNGTCETHFSENYCNCPEDCFDPDRELVCGENGDSLMCGTTHCLQDGNDCIQKTPKCEAKKCSWSVERKTGQICNTVKRQCVEL